MPKGRKNGRNGGRSYSANKGDTVTMRGRTMLSLAAMGDRPLHPSEFAPFTGARLEELPFLFQQYRWRKCRMTFLASVTGSPAVTAGLAVVGFLPAVAVSSPSNPKEIIEFDHAAVSIANQTLPTRLGLPAHVLHGEKDYYECGNTNDAPGRFAWAAVDANYAVVDANIVPILVEWEIEFYGRTPTSITYQRMREALGQDDEFQNDVIEIPAKIPVGQATASSSKQQGFFGRRSC